MRSAILQYIPGCAASIIALALAVHLFFGSPVETGMQALEWCLAGVAVSLAAVSIVGVVQRRRATDTALQLELEALCRADFRDLADGALEDHQSTSGLDENCADALDRLRQRLFDLSNRARELEGQRATAESRAKRLETQAERANWIVNGLTEPVIAIDKFDELVLANPSAQALLSIGDLPRTDRAIASLVHCQKLVDLLTETGKRKAPSQRSCEVQLESGDGGSGWFRATARSIPAQTDRPNVDGPSQGVVAVLHDISVQKAMQKRNAEFVSSVSHEMKTPLAGIKAYVELLVDGDAEDEKSREQFLEIINAQADRLQRLVDNLLNLARIEAGVVAVNKQSRSLNEVLEKALQVLQPAATAKQITLSADLSPMYLGAFLDHDMALQAAINLLSNAVKYTPVGGHVTLRSRMMGDEVCFDVEDTGVGLSPEDCKKVFEKFYRVAKDKDLAAGTGLGLPLVKHIVEDVHGGRIAVESTPGKGSTFSVFLPAAATLVKTASSSTA